MKKLRYSDAGAENIMNLPSVRDWFAGGGNFAKGFDRTTVVLGASREEVARVFGTRHQTFTSEFRFDVWRVEHDGLHFWVLSAKAKGTGIEVEPATSVWKPGDEDRILSFLNYVYEELKALEERQED